MSRAEAAAAAAAAPDPAGAVVASVAAPVAAGAPSPQYLAWLASERRSRFTIRAWQLGLLVAFLVGWEVLPRLQWINPMLTSYPSALWPTFLELIQGTAQQAGLGRHAASTVFATVVGFSLAMVLGVAIAAVLWWWNAVYRVLDPYLVVANAMPKTAFVPIFYLWLGATLSIYGMALAIALFITVLMIYAGFQGIDPNKIKLAQTFGATRGQILRKVVLPGSVPTLIATLKVNAGLSLVGVVVGEFQSASLGLGYLIMYGSQIFKMNIVMVAITLLAIFSALMYLAIYLLEAAVMRRR
jgi:NitT/TauT family transport system permease protein